MSITEINPAILETNFHYSPPGFSKESDEIQKEILNISRNEAFRDLNRNIIALLEQIGRNSILKEIDEIGLSCSEKNWDGYDAAPIEMESVNAAIHFLKGLQSSYPIPDVIPEPDGDLALEWENGSDNWLIVSFHGASIIHFAAKFGEGTRFEGKQPNDHQNRKFIHGFLDRILIEK